MKMPELPPPDLRVTAFGELEPADRRQFVMGDFFTADQLRARDLQVAALVREECAKLCEAVGNRPYTGPAYNDASPRTGAWDCAAVIREQK